MPRKPSNAPASNPKPSAPLAVAPAPIPPPGYTDAAGLAVCRDVEEGLPLPEAFLCNGIPAQTGARWLLDHPPFADEVAFARGRYLRSLIRELREATAGSGARHDWRASLALLERFEQARSADPKIDHPAAQPSRPIFTQAQIVDLQARRRRSAAVSPTTARSASQRGEAATQRERSEPTTRSSQRSEAASGFAAH